MIEKDTHFVDKGREIVEEIQSVTSSDSGSFRITGKQDLDSDRSEAWKSFLHSDALLEAYTPPPNSPYFKYVKTKTIRSVDGVGKKLQPRYSDGERKSEQELENLLQDGKLGRDTAIILNSGGAHSVAMAVKLAEHGYQPVIMFDSIPHSKGTNKSEQELATLLYYAEKMKTLKAEQKIQADSPPVFVLDCHRGDSSFHSGGDNFNNSYSFQSADFPTTDELKAQGIKRVILLNEGDQKGFIRPDFQSIDRIAAFPDLKPIFEEYMRQGIQIEYTGIAPWQRDDVFGKFRSKLLKGFRGSFDYLDE